MANLFTRTRCRTSESDASTPTTARSGRARQRTRQSDALPRQRRPLRAPRWPTVAACGSWCSVGAVSRGSWRLPALRRSALTVPVLGPAMARGTRRWVLRVAIPKGVCKKREILQHARLQLLSTVVCFV